MCHCRVYIRVVTVQASMSVLPPVCNCDGVKTIDTPCPIHGFDGGSLSELGPCPTCKAFVTLTYTRPNAPSNDDPSAITNGLVGVCDVCDTVGAYRHPRD